MEVEIKPVDESKVELPLPESEIIKIDTSEAHSELNESKPEINEKEEENLEEQHKPRERKKWKKGKKIVRNKGYPKYYLNAYVRYCNETRPKVCETHAELDPVEVTKLVASMWYGLPKTEKQPYLDDAKADKERYKRELKEFNRLNPEGSVPIEEKSPDKLKEPKKRVRKSKSSKPSSSPTIVVPEVQPQPNPVQPTSIITALPSTSKQFVVNQSTHPVKKDDELPKTFFIGMDCELPIFTDAFLEHNKTIEAELKILRKNNIEMEQQNSVLSKHVENLANGVHKVESEIALTKKKNMQMEVYLTKLRCTLAANFNSISFPGSKGGATVENIDKYMTDLAQEAKKQSTIAIKTRDILFNIDLKNMP